MKHLCLYLAGGVFDIAQRTHNMRLEVALFRAAVRMKIKCRIISPQNEVFGHGIDEIPNICAKHCADPETIFVGCLDGASADDGMAVEYGIAISSNKKAILYRTDFRTVPEQEIGINAMFNLPETKLIFKPCFLLTLEETNEFYRELAEKILQTAMELTEQTK